MGHQLFQPYGDRPYPLNASPHGRDKAKLGVDTSNKT